MNKSLFSLLLIVHVSFLAISMARPTPRNLMWSSNWEPIQNVSDPKVQYMGSYAVSEYDKTAESHIEFIKVVNGSNLYISFNPHYITMWEIWLKAKPCGQPGEPSIYQAQVNENFNPPQYGGNYLSYDFLKKGSGAKGCTIRVL